MVMMEESIVVFISYEHIIQYYIIYHLTHFRKKIEIADVKNVIKRKKPIAS